MMFLNPPCSWGSLSHAASPLLPSIHWSLPALHLASTCPSSTWKVGCQVGCPVSAQTPSPSLGSRLGSRPKYPGFYLRQPQTTRVSQSSHLRPYKGKGPDAAEPIWIRFQTRASALRCVIKALFQRGAPAGGIRTPGQRGPSARHTNERQSGRLGVVWDLGEQPALPPGLRGRGRRPWGAAGSAARGLASEGGPEAGSSGSVTLLLPTAGKGSAYSGSRGPGGPVGASE